MNTLNSLFDWVLVAGLRASLLVLAVFAAQVLDGAPAPRRAAYGHTLLKMETEFPPAGLCLGFVGILQRGGTLRERINAIISQLNSVKP